MAEERQQEAGQPTVEVTEEESSVDRLLNLVNVTKPTSVVDIEQFSDSEAESEAGGRIAAAVRVFLDAVAQSSQIVERVDKNMIDFYIAELDRKLGEQLDEILHHEKLQQLESAWRGLKFLVDRTNFRSNIKIEILDISKDALREDFEYLSEVVQSGLYHHVYGEEYDTPGGEPIAAMIANYEFGASAPDIALLQNVSKVAAAAHCTFIAAASHRMFGVDRVDGISSIPDLENIFETGQYAKWRSFREEEDSRYVGLTFPRFLLRTPYDPEANPVKGFTYVEKVADHDKYLWGNASFALGANMTRSFERNGWCVQIRGPESGGLVENLPLHLYQVGGNQQIKIPTEITITDGRESELSELGFIPLSWYRNTDYAVFFSANSVQKPKTYTGPDGAKATANSRLCSRLPYLFLVSRLAHYLKAMQRQNIGGYKDRVTLQQELQNWIAGPDGLVTGTPNPSPRIIAQRPLKEAQITVSDIEKNPGFFKVDIYVRPHIQLEGMDIGLSIVSQMPKAK